MKNNYRLVPYELIVSANRENINAINSIIAFYSGYIATLSTRFCQDEYGNRYRFTDDTIRHRLETKLITKILTFKISA